MWGNKSVAWRIGNLRGAMLAGKIGFMIGFVACVVLFLRILTETQAGQVLGTGVPAVTISLFRGAVTMCFGGFGYWAVFGNYADILIFESLFGFYPRLPFRKIDPMDQRIIDEKMAALLRLIGDTDSEKSKRLMNRRFSELVALAERFGYEVRNRDDLATRIPERELAEKN